MVKESDRSAESGNVVLFDLGEIGLDEEEGEEIQLEEGGEDLKLIGKVVRELSAGDGWIDQVRVSWP